MVGDTQLLKLCQLILVNREGSLLPLSLFLNAIVRFLKQTFLESTMIITFSWHINADMGICASVVCYVLKHI